MKIIHKFLSVLLFIILLPYHILHLFWVGFKALSLFLSRGFYFYLEKISQFFQKLTNAQFLDRLSLYFRRKQEDPSHIVLIFVWFFTFLYLFDAFYIQDSMITKIPMIRKKHEDIEYHPVVEKKEPSLFSKDYNLYRIYGKYGLDDISISELKKANVDTVAWIIVEGTNVNYPVVQSSNNDYYLNHSYDHSYTHNGWIFMDYRVDESMNHQNTIFYGHNLVNHTAFGSLSNIFSNSNSDLKIMIITEDTRYTYQLFSAYEIDPEIYYLQTDFYSQDSYDQFLNTLRSRNTLSIDIPVSVYDKIITLSTCTDDNNGREVFHAKLIHEEKI